MATLKQTLSINANALTSSTSLSNQILLTEAITQGGILTENITEVVGAPKDLLLAANYAEGSKVYLKNVGTTHNFYVSFEASGTGGEGAWIYLLPGDWSFFPWMAAVNLRVYCTNAAGSTLEYGVFEV